MSDSVTNRYDIVYYFDITDGNPNGDPDAGNMPRLDPETGQGLVTDVCIKRKIRNYVGLVCGDQPPNEIYVKEKAILNEQHERAYQALKIDAKKRIATGSKRAEEDRELTRWMCSNFFDIRVFGAVMTTDTNCGQVRGPVQFEFARSIHPITVSEHTVTRCAVTTVKESKSQDGGNRTMGRKYTVPYGLYRVHIYISPHLASGPNGTGFSEEDLNWIKSALNEMFEFDRSSARANMRSVACIAFKHENPLGNARADKLFDRVKCRPVSGVQSLPGDGNGTDEGRPPRSFADYTLTIDEENLPAGVTVERWIDWADGALKLVV